MVTDKQRWEHDTGASEEDTMEYLERVDKD